mmetsp:Transcript_9148/g.23915  ORF Transcript_9148/g.23915 Transcript_9148/m.23915 type:complete len:295 (+) Transcript_9148:359-1243(+)
MNAVLRVTIPHVEDLLVRLQPRREAWVALPLGATASPRPQPSAEHDAALVHLVGRVGELSELRGALLLCQEPLVPEVLLLVVQKHGVLMQEERREDVLEPDRHGTSEELHRVLVNDAAVTRDAVRVQHQETNVAALARHGRRIVNREDDAAILLILHEARRPVVEDAGDAADCEALLGVHLPPRLHIEPLGIRVAVACDVVVRDQEVSRVHRVLEEHVPSQLKVPQVHRELNPLVLQSRVMQLLDERRVLGSGLLRGVGAVVWPNEEEVVLLAGEESPTLRSAVALVLLLQVIW